MALHASAISLTSGKEKIQPQPVLDARETPNTSELLGQTSVQPGQGVKSSFTLCEFGKRPAQHPGSRVPESPRTFSNTQRIFVCCLGAPGADSVAEPCWKGLVGPSGQGDLPCETCGFVLCCSNPACETPAPSAVIPSIYRPPSPLTSPARQGSILASQQKATMV